MSKKNFDIYFDLGASKIRVAGFDIVENNQIFFLENNCLTSLKTNQLDLSITDQTLEKMILEIEKKTGEYLNSINLMLDSPEALSISLSVSKKNEKKFLEKEDIEYLIQDAKQQVLSAYQDKSIIHIVTSNYKVNNHEYASLPLNIECNKFSIDIVFICFPKVIIENLEKLFSKHQISIDNFICSSYAKSLNYKSNFFLNENILFVDVGFKKTSIIYYNKNEIIFFDVLPIGGNHITSDISKILNLNMEESENIKINFDQQKNILNEKKISANLVQQIISARIEEILELSLKTIKLNLDFALLDQHKVVLMGDGSIILDSEFKEKISFSKKIELIEESTEDICESAFKLIGGFNKQEVVIIPKKAKKKGFFEKLFHLFR